MINTILEKAILKKQIEIFGDGSFKRNYIYNKDVAKALSNVAEQDLETSEIYNLASSQSYNVNEVIELIQETIKEPLDVKYVNSRKSDLKSILIDNSKFTEAHPNFKFTDLVDGIQNTYNYIKENKT